MEQLIERGLQTATEQSLLMAKELESQEGMLPRTFEDGKLKTATAPIRRRLKACSRASSQKLTLSIMRLRRT